MFIGIIFLFHVTPISNNLSNKKNCGQVKNERVSKCSHYSIIIGKIKGLTRVRKTKGYNLNAVQGEKKNKNSKLIYKQKGR